MKTYTIGFEGHTINIETNNGFGVISSDLKGNAEDDSDYNAAVDGIESLLLSLACEGVNVEAPEFVAALTITIQNISDKL